MRYPIIVVLLLSACMLIGIVSAETTIAAPSGSIEGTVDLPVTISGITGATGVSFELSYDKSIVHIESITASSQIPGSNVQPNFNNSIGYAKVAITNTQGITAQEPTSLAIVRCTRVGPGTVTITILNPTWSDAQFMPFGFDVVGNAGAESTPAITVTPTATAAAASGSQGSSAPSGASTATPTPESTAAPAATTAMPVATTAQPVSSGDTNVTHPAASPDIATESSHIPVTSKAAPGFSLATICIAGVLGAALVLYRRL